MRSGGGNWGGGGLISNNAFAQEATVLYGTTTPNVVSVTADNYIIYKATVAGTMTATVIAVTGTVTGGNFTPRPVNATGMTFLTLRGLDSCSIDDGCAAFGFENASDANARLAILRTMDLSTLTMFFASGADLNERANGDSAAHFLLYHFLEGNLDARFSVLVAAGADVNARDSGNFTMLHVSAISGDTNDINVLLSSGADVNLQNNSGFTPLDYAIFLGYTSAQNALIAAGGRCNSQSGGACP